MADIEVKGTAFSSDAVSGDVYYRTDLGAWYQYDGSGWNQAPAGNGFLNVGGVESVTISGGVATITKTYVAVTAETTAADDLDTISGTSEGDIIILTRGGSYTVTVKDGTGNLNTAGDFAMNSIHDYIVLINHNGSVIKELSRSDNA